MFRCLLAATTIGAFLATPLASAMAFSGMIDGKLASGASPLVEQVQFRRGGRGFGGGHRFIPHRGGFGRRGGFGGGRRFHGGYRGGYGGRGFGIGAGVAGLAAGALIGGAIASQAAPDYGYGGDASAYCAQRFKSYDPASGTYLGYDGVRHSCP